MNVITQLTFRSPHFCRARAQRTNNHYWLDIRIEQTFYGYTNASKPIKNQYSYNDY